MSTYTKVVCTIGPSVDSYEKILELAEAGMNVARLNFSHGTQDGHLKTIKTLKRVREELKKPLAIMLDTQGPEIRVAKVKDDLIKINDGERFKLVKDFTGNREEIAITPFEVLDSVAVGTKILFADGYLLSEVMQKSSEHLTIEVKNAGTLKSRNRVNIPDVTLNLPAMTENDISDIKFGVKNDIDIIAASFIRSAEHVLAIKQLLADEGGSNIMVIAKIESREGIENFDSIVEVADGIMVARGDLGVEVDIAMIPKLQKMMIRKCYRAGKPVITATQMLESMINNPRPTRAEVSDVANAIYDSSSAVMLSGETAAGKYPIETVIQMKKIIKQAEDDFDYKRFFYRQMEADHHNISTSVSLAAVNTAYSSEARAIFIFSVSGFTAQLVSRLRPDKAIVALTTSKKTYNQLACIWGVIPLFVENCHDADQAFKIMADFVVEQNLASFGDLVIMTAGVPFGKKGSTNMMLVGSIGNILVRGFKGYGKKAKGKVAVIMTAKALRTAHVKNKIMVIPTCSSSYVDAMKEAAGVVLQNNVADTISEKYAVIAAKEYGIPLVVRADNAMSLLKDEEEVILDTQRALVYKEE